MHQNERRRSPRAGVMGSAIVLAHERYVGTYVLENLSASGALLVGDTRLAVGDGVRLLLQLHGRSRRFALEAVVARQGSRGPQSLFAAEFRHVSPVMQDALQSAVLQHLASPPRDLAVLIVDADPVDAAWLHRDIQSLGCDAVVVQTALDAIIGLQQRGERLETVLAGAALPSIDGLGLLDFIAVDYPKVRRVLFCSGTFARLHQEALGSGRVHALLEQPWTRDSLLRALGRPT